MPDASNTIELGRPLTCLPSWPTGPMIGSGVPAFSTSA